MTDHTTAIELLAEWDWLPSDEQLAYPRFRSNREHWDWCRYPYRVLTALRLARDLDTCRALLLGEPVDPDRLDQAELRRARERELVRLDFRAIDLLAGG